MLTIGSSPPGNPSAYAAVFSPNSVTPPGKTGMNAETAISTHISHASGRAPSQGSHQMNRYARLSDCWMQRAASMAENTKVKSMAISQKKIDFEIEL